MDKKEAFKEFLRAHPKITEYLKNNKDSSIQNYMKFMIFMVKIVLLGVHI